MYEKVNPSHPDKAADRIAGAIVDLAYSKRKDPKIAVEVLLGHGKCHIIAESDTSMAYQEILPIVRRIAGQVEIEYDEVPQDPHLAENQSKGFRCGDNGIFKGTPVTKEQDELTSIARWIYKRYPTDGKYILDGDRLIVCQSNATTNALKAELKAFGKETNVNPLGDWTGGPDADTGATNRKLGSDMGDSVTGGGLHGKDLSKADVSANIHAFLKAQLLNREITFSCAIGDDTIDGLPFEDVVEEARLYIKSIGGFERFAEWGLIR